MPRAYTPELGRAWQERVASGEALDRIRYRIDKDKIRVIKAMILAEHGRKALQGRLLSDIQAPTLGIDPLFALAKRLQVPAEWLVDEEYYLSRVNMKPYVITFEGMRKGIRPSELVKQDGPGARKMFYTLLSAWTGKEERVYVGYLENLCQRVGLPLAALFMVMGRPKEASLYGAIQQTLSRLAEYDMYTLAGVANALLLSGDDDEKAAGLLAAVLARRPEFRRRAEGTG